MEEPPMRSFERRSSHPPQLRFPLARSGCRRAVELSGSTVLALVIALGGASLGCGTEARKGATGQSAHEAASGRDVEEELEEQLPEPEPEESTRPDANSKSGLYAMKGPTDPVPQDPGVYDGLTATEVGEATGAGGLGLVGTGRGGGGTGEGTIGLGNTGLIGKGGGGGTGSGYGRGSGAGFGGRGGGNVMGGLYQSSPKLGDDNNSEAYTKIDENQMISVADQPLSTFSIDVDTASYSFVRRYLIESKQLPPVDAVRVEELLNYFTYDDPAPPEGEPFAVSSEVSNAPWAPQHRLVRVAIKGTPLPTESLPARNLVFLLDVSGSMASPDKLPLLRQGLNLLVRDLRPQDKVAIVVYAGASGLLLPSTSGKHRTEIINAITSLESGGSTNGGQGIELAYKVAQENFVEGGINRVILATDGDFNVGTTSQAALERLIESKRKSKVFLTVLGFGTGNTKDETMELLADKGNGNYAYIDSIHEAEKVLVRESGATLATIAKDVKLQVEFNPKLVARYRLVGYENRVLAAQDFNDDKKDAGEIGAGAGVTALYELELAGVSAAPGTDVDPLKYQSDRSLSVAAASDELMTVKVRYKHPAGDTSKLLSQPMRDASTNYAQASESMRFSASVAMFAMLLRDSSFKGSSSFEVARELAMGARGNDPHGDRAEFVRLIDAAKEIGTNGPRAEAIVANGGYGARVPTIRMAKPTVQGNLDKDIVRRIIRAHINEVRHCYNQALAKNPNASGRVTVDFVINGKGDVKVANVAESTLKDSSVGVCIEKAVRRWKFPKVGGGHDVMVSYPFVMSPG